MDIPFFSKSCLVYLGGSRKENRIHVIKKLLAILGYGLLLLKIRHIIVLSTSSICAFFGNLQISAPYNIYDSINAVNVFCMGTLYLMYWRVNVNCEHCSFAFKLNIYWP